MKSAQASRKSIELLFLFIYKKFPKPIIVFCPYKQGVYSDVIIHNLKLYSPWIIFFKLIGNWCPSISKPQPTWTT